LRSWCETSATKARCCSRTSSTLSATSLNEWARRQSPGGPPAAATRGFRQHSGSRRRVRSRPGLASAASRAGARYVPPGCVRSPPKWCATPSTTVLLTIVHFDWLLLGPVRRVVWAGRSAVA
jgi:hypothetical protein